MGYGTQQYGNSQYGEAQALNFIRSFQETVGTSDTRTFDTSIVRAEEISLKDNYTRTVDYFRTLQDVNSFDDTYSRVATLDRLYQEDVAADDIYNSSASLFRTNSESFSVSDNLQPLSIALVRTEDLGVNESYSRVLDAFRTYDALLEVNEVSSLRPEIFIRERMAFDDTFSSSYLVFRTFDESVDLTDNLTSFSISKVLLEEFAVDETSATAAELYRLHNEDVSLSESVSSVGTFERLFSEDISVEDVYSRSVDYFRLNNENLAVSEVFNRSASLLRSYNEQFKTIDSDAELARTIYRVIIQSFGVSDNVSYGAIFKRIYSEEVEIDESLDFLISKLLREDVTVDEEFNIANLLRGVAHAEFEADVFERFDLDADIN